MHSSPSQPRRGFTLIELLTVIAIIGILAAIIIPTVGAVRAKAAQSRSVSNLRQLSSGMQLFANDYKGRLPIVNDNRSGNPYGSWDMGLLPYLSVKRDGLTVGQSAEALFFHPRDPAPERTDGKARRTYAMNAATGGPGKKNADSLTLNQIPGPSRVIVLAERPNSANSTVAGWSFADIANPGQCIANMTGQQELNPGGKFNFGFVDGHVETLTLEQSYGTGSLTAPKGYWTVAEGD
jgi:prepilin-type N-terminal cleavage/methylation domain-containing protein/prepilin-type processing-associated H-X9-DG protein